MIQKFHVSKNLFDKTATNTANGYIENTRLNASDGSTVYNTYNSVSEYIAINPDTDYTLDFGVTTLNSNLGVCFYNSAKVFLRGYASGIVKQFTFNSGNDAKYCRITYINSSINSTMLNIGQTALPYEPYGDTWNTKSYSKIVDTTQQVTSYPVVVRPTENTLPSWTIKGNMQQTGTPTPQNPIQPSECGDMTENLFDVSTVEKGRIDNGEVGYVSQTSSLTIEGGTVSFTTTAAYRGVCSGFFEIPEGTETITFNFIRNEALGVKFVFYDSNKTWLNADVTPQLIEIPPATASIPTGAKYVRLSFTGQITGGYSYTMSNLMLNTGSTALPYQPYGYVLPVKTGSTTTPVYLGQVQTTRRIRKYEFTGQESFFTDTTTIYNSTLYFGTRIGSTVFGTNRESLNSHFVTAPKGDNPQALNYECSGFNPASSYSDYYYMRINLDTIGVSPSASVNVATTAFKTWLAAQYAAGTPVCVWYVLATETTITLNEPLRKISTYSDSVSGTNLAVTAQSPTTIDVDTSLKPSEMGLTYTGLKMCGRKRKSANLLAWDGNLIGNSSLGVGTNDAVISSIIDVRNVNSLYFTGDVSLMNSGVYRIGKANNPIVEGSNVLTSFSSSFTGGILDVSDCNYVLISASTFGKPDSNRDLIKATYMCNTGSSPLPYAPYWK